jgi:hypothetical protein
MADEFMFFHPALLLLDRELLDAIRRSRKPACRAMIDLLAKCVEVGSWPTTPEERLHADRVRCAAIDALHRSVRQRLRARLMRDAA